MTCYNMCVRGVEGLAASSDPWQVGFAWPLRRSELAALNVADLRFVREGLILRVRRSKNDLGTLNS